VGPRDRTLQFTTDATKPTLKPPIVLIGTVLTQSSVPIKTGGASCDAIGRSGRASKASGEDRTAIELFVAEVRGWDNGLRRFLDASAGEE